MTIVHVVYSMEMGGAESLVAQLCRLQRAHGHEVSVVAQANLGTLGERMREEGFRVDVVGTGNPLLRFPRWARIFRELRPEVVHCHNVAPTIQAAPAARLCGARVVISTRHSLVAPPYEWKMEALYGVAARFCDAIVGICEATCSNLRGAPLARQTRIVRVYNGADRLPEIEKAERERLREEAGAARDAVVVLFVGRLALIKDLPTLVRAFAAATSRRAELRLWIVGDGPARATLEALAKKLSVEAEVRFWGERHDVARFFRAADVFAMSSLSEGLPMSLLQAMSVSLPALVTDVGGMAEVVRYAEGGIATPVGDVAAMAEAMVHLAESESDRRRLGAAASKAYERAFTLERMDEGYMQLYQR